MKLSRHGECNGMRELARSGPRLVSARSNRIGSGASEFYASASKGRRAATGDRSFVFSVAASLLPLPARNEWGEGRGEGKLQCPSSPRPSPPAGGREGEEIMTSP